ncbi:MAG: PQQ-binding-like beta-propeller repeat protein [Pseudomonadota bacterium]
MRPYQATAASLGLVAGLLLGGCRQPDAAAPEPENAKPIVREAAEKQTPDELWAERCAACHDDAANKRAAGREQLAQLSPAHLVFALTNGVMKAQATGLNLRQTLDLAQMITGYREPFEPAPDHYCEDRTIDLNPVVPRWAMNDRSSFSLPPEASPIADANVHKLRLAWAFGLPEVANARSQPVITANTIYVAATSGHLFALDTQTGCLRWHGATAAPPRTALTLGTIEDEAVLFFGDGESHLQAVSAVDGTTLWRTEIRLSEHSLLTGAPVQHADQLIVPVSLYEVGLAADPDYECCRSHGGVVALDVASGKQRWAYHTTGAATRQGVTAAGVARYGPSGAPVWSTPTVDPKRGVVYVGTGQNASRPATGTSDAVLALKLDSGELVWKFQAIAGDVYNQACDLQPPGPNCPNSRGPDHDIGAAVVLVTTATGEDRLIVGQKSGDVYALDPDQQGKVIWQRRVGAGSALGGIHWGLAVADGVIYAPAADPPFPIPYYRPAPGLYALSANDGRLVWSTPVERGCKTNVYEYFDRETLYPACSFYFGLSSPPLVINDLVFAPALDGKVRAFHRDSGAVVWETQTARPFPTVNGIEAHGGSIDVAGVQVAGNRLFVQSGYGQFGQLPGNALLVFELPPNVQTR